MRLRVVQDELRREPDEFIWLLIGLCCHLAEDPPMTALHKIPDTPDCGPYCSVAPVSAPC